MSTGRLRLAGMGGMVRAVRAVRTGRLVGLGAVAVAVTFCRLVVGRRGGLIRPVVALLSMLLLPVLAGEGEDRKDSEEAESQDDEKKDGADSHCWTQEEQRGRTRRRLTRGTAGAGLGSRRRGQRMSCDDRREVERWRMGGDDVTAAALQQRVAAGVCTVSHLLASAVMRQWRLVAVEKGR
jgi:hypothetical protein